jgi:hypothetical protein
MPGVLKAVPTGRFRPAVSKTQPRCRRRLASSHTRHPDHATSHARSRTRRRPSVVPLPSVPPPLSGDLRHLEILHGERSLEHPPCRFFYVDCLAELPLPPPPRCRTTAGRRSPHLVGERHRRSGFPPFPSARSSGELSPPPTCLAGGLSAVGARAPSFAPPPPR